jgi:hypothetical protein
MNNIYDLGIVGVIGILDIVGILGVVRTTPSIPRIPTTTHHIISRLTCLDNYAILIKRVSDL